jgi:membrane protein DedA with SNARE-associated domain
MVDLSFLGSDLTVWLTHYGSFALFVLLCMGIFGLPVVEETLMVLAGILVKSNDLNMLGAFLAALMGTICGISISYYLGRAAGKSIIKQYRKGVSGNASPYVTSGRLRRFSQWILLLGYLIPGIRHTTGIFAGTSAMQFKEFALFAYAGAFLWISLYLSIGYFWGQMWFPTYALFFQNIEMAMDLFTAAIVILFVIYITYQMKKDKNKV